jgi:stage V sporulation protein B
MAMRQISAKTEGQGVKTFASAVMLITVFAVSTRAIGFVFRIFLSRVLGAEMLGVYQIAMSFFMVFLTIIASGLPLVISKEVAQAVKRDSPQDIPKIAIAGLALAIILSAILCLAVYFLREFVGVIFTDKRCLYILLILMPGVLFSAPYVALRAVWWGEKRFFLLGATELFEQIVRVILFVLVLGVGFMGLDSAGLAAASFSLACLVSAGFVVVVYLRRPKLKNLGRPKNKTNYYSPLIKSATPITGVRVIGSIALPIISIIIPLRLVTAGWTPSQAIAQYGIMVGMTMPLLTIPGTIISALSTALVPELSGLRQSGDLATVRKRVTGSLRFTLFIVFLMLPAFMAIGEAIGIFLYDNALSGAYLVQMAWVMIPLALSQITNAILNSLGAEIKALKNYVYGSIALFICVWFLPSLMGVTALAFGMGLCMTIASILNLIMIARITGAGSGMVKLITLFTIISLPAALLGFFAFGIAKHIWPSFISLALAGGASVAVVMVLSHIFKVVDLREFRLLKSSRTAK